MEPNRHTAPYRRRNTVGLSGIYDSRRNPGGIGFPSCNRALARLAPNNRDPHGYYAEIGVHPDASPAEIRTAVRALYKRYHSDTGEHPSTEKMTRIHNIATVLLDPEARQCYNRTPEGMRLMDAVYAQELIDAGLTMPEGEFEEVFAPRNATGYHPPGARYDFFAVDHRAGDSMLANRWYHHLVAAAGPTGYRRVIKVMLTDAAHPSFTAMASIMGIPRYWTPCDTLAKLLFVKAGFLFDTPDPAKRLGLSP